VSYTNDSVIFLCLLAEINDGLINVVVQSGLGVGLQVSVLVFIKTNTNNDFARDPKIVIVMLNVWKKSYKTLAFRYVLVCS